MFFVFFACSILKHQLNTDILHENGAIKKVLNLILFWYC